MLKNDISLRHASPQDWPAIAALLDVNKLPLNGAREHLSAYLLAIQGEQLVGVSGMETYGSVALLRSVAIAPALRGQGVGKLLVARLLEDAKRRQIAKVYLLTETASEYFARVGFQPESIEQAPQALKASAEFQGVCPASAAFLSLTLTEAPS